MSDADLDSYLAEADLAPMTDRTVTQPERLREIVAEVRRQGYAIVDQELEEGLRAIAAPIHGTGGVVTAAINVSAHASRVSMAAMRTELLPHLLETARRIETDLRSQGLG
jgi:IclR family pca regulon transcriptional regulator